MFGGGGSPQTFSQGGNPATYVPTAQPQMDALYQQVLGGFPTSPGATPAAEYYPTAQRLFSQFLNPYGQDARVNEAFTAADRAWNMGQQGAPLLQGAGTSILNTAFDPQSALYNQMRARAGENAAVANSQAGLGGSPYGASVAANALNNFDINWQNQLLNRMATGGQAGSQLLQAAPALGYQTGMMPYNLAQTVGLGGINAGQAAAGLGNLQYALPQQLANDLQSYLQLGQAASLGALQGGNLGFNQTAQGIGGLLSGANALFGGNGLLSGSGLLGGGGLGLGSSGFAALPAATQTALAAPFFDTAASSVFDAPAAGLGLLGS